jgi:hypothetical protein
MVGYESGAKHGNFHTSADTKCCKLQNSACKQVCCCLFAGVGVTTAWCRGRPRWLASPDRQAVTLDIEEQLS